MKKNNYDGRGAEECSKLDWVELSEELESSAIVNETLSQIVSEDLKVDTSDMDGVREAVESFYAYEKKPAGKRKPEENGELPREEIDEEQAIRKSVDEKIIIRSEELKKKRKSEIKSRRTQKSDKATVSSKKKSKSAAKATKVSDDSFRHAKGLDKYRKMGILPTKKNGPSDFRKKSANWRYDNVPKADITDEAIEKTAEEESFADKLRNFTPVQWSAAAMAVVLLITSVMTTTVYADYRGEINKEAAMAHLPVYNDDPSAVAYSGEDYTTEDVELEDAASAMTDSEGKMLSLILTSVEKDLKVKLVDEEDTLVKGVKWGITVTDSKEKESSYEDEDEDGIIHLTGINAGDYSVSITDSDGLAGYVYPTVGQKVSVKAKVEYKVIANIKDEIKKESEVNAAAEDNGNKAADVEVGTAPADTVEFVESSKEENGETYVEATVDLTKTEVIASVGNRLFGALKKLSDQVKFGTNNIIASVSVRMVAAEESPVCEHAFETVEINEPTCDKPGTSVEKCSKCGEVKEGSEKEIPASEHDFKDGKCTRCGAADPNYTCQHNYVEEKTTAATCVKEGEKTLKCGKCGDTKTEKIAALGHDFKDGKCTRCGAADPNYTCQHNYVEEKTTAATCVKEGEKAFKCDKCGATKIEVIAALGHDFKDGVCTRCKEKDPNYIADKYKPEAQLYDAVKNPLYVYDNGSYRLAKYADYKNFTTFYRKEVGYVYTGWQNIDGKTYYYTKDHEKVTGKQIIGGVEYTFDSDGALNNGSGTLGIDVSKYQPSINWSSVKDSGIDFVIIRCGYRGASTGALIEDPYFKSHIKGAKSAGLKVGVYFFSTALSEAEAVEEASMCAALCSGYGLNYPVFLDVESSSRPGYNTLSASQRTANIKAFCQTIASAGYTPGLYANKTWLSEKINTSSLSCKIWLAQYNANGPTYSGRYDIWQYTSKGSVNGISGNVDMNKSYLRY
jgi:GH25 family lysozyme M1 (1,4-beta-N-acetylmuramidase)